MSTPPAAPTVRRTIVVPSAGSYDRLTLQTGPIPTPGPGEVRIDVRAIGVNFADTIVRMGLYASAKQYVGWPITPGFEVAGVVGAVGAGVDGLAIGAEVFAVTRFGGYSSHVVVPRAQVFARPARTTLIEAAAIPAVFMTAWYALFELAHPRRGAKVLVHSAAGGVGGALLQLAKVAGCEAIGVVGGGAKVATAKAAGADHVIDKSSTELWPAAERLAPDGYDVVLDANGVSTLGASYRHLRRGGKLVVYGFHSMMPRAGGTPSWPRLAFDYVRTPRFNPLDMTNQGKSVLAFNLSYLFDRVDLLEEGLTQLADWLGSGAIVAPPVATYPLGEVARAHADLESGQTVGKLVLVP